MELLAAALAPDRSGAGVGLLNRLLDEVEARKQHEWVVDELVEAHLLEDTQLAGATRELPMAIG